MQRNKKIWPIYRTDEQKQFLWKHRQWNYYTKILPSVFFKYALRAKISLIKSQRKPKELFLKKQRVLTRKRNYKQESNRNSRANNYSNLNKKSMIGISITEEKKSANLMNRLNV